MAKIDRFNGNLEAPASAALGTERTIFGTGSQSDDLTDQFNAFLLRGWGIVGPSDQPTLQDFNAMGFTLGQIHAYLHQVGVAEYNALQEYHAGSFANVAGVLYVSLVDTNVGNPPASSPAQWKKSDQLDSLRINVASAANVDLTALAPNTRHINITGSTPIASFTIDAGSCYFVRFNAATTLVESAFLDTQTGNNIITAAGDSCIIRATAPGVVEVLVYVDATVQSLTANGYRKFKDGLIIQWAEVNFSGTQEISAAFPISFPNAVLQVFPTDTTVTATQFYMSWRKDLTTLSTVRLRASDAAAGLASYFAIGY